MERGSKAELAPGKTVSAEGCLTRGDCEHEEAPNAGEAGGTPLTTSTVAATWHLLEIQMGVGHG